jgi:hypothetical protein
MESYFQKIVERISVGRQLPALPVFQKSEKAPLTIFGEMSGVPETSFQKAR